MKRFETSEFVVNGAGRSVPLFCDRRSWRPYAEPRGVPPPVVRVERAPRSCREFPASGDKRAPSLREAIVRANLHDGATISTHHHFRDGDLTALQVFEVARELGLRNLRWFPSATFPCHRALIPYLEDGTIRCIEGSLNGPLGDFATDGRMGGPSVLRSHGGRYRAAQDGEVTIDLAVIAAPCADAFGNANGLRGAAACGPLGFALADAQFAEHVIVATDRLEPFPCVPWHIQGNHVDQVVVLEQIGDPSKIVSGTTKVTRSPDRRLIAELAAAFVEKAGLMREGFSFQAGAGGTSLAFTIYLAERMRAAGVRARFIRGGGTKVLVEMLRDGLADYVLDGQCFDLDAVASMRDDPRHQATSPFTSYNYHGKGNFASILDLAVLGATEIDLEFNANVVTHSDGRIQHGIGGWQDALFAGCSILAVPTFRNRLPVIRDRVTTLCAPGALVDVVVTERGIAINPARPDLVESVRGAGLPLRSLEELKAEAERLCGTPEPVAFSDELVGLVSWVDGTLIDSLFRPETP
ncbi:MAG: citrate lyase subunit alpha [Fimbriimonadaceae bacterium]|nr:citrate lyase subunit alpha [Fimbriimonadaceae bacterium]